MVFFFLLLGGLAVYAIYSREPGYEEVIEQAKYCPSCGRPVEPDFLLCPYCGEKLPRGC